MWLSEQSFNRNEFSSFLNERNILPQRPESEHVQDRGIHLEHRYTGDHSWHTYVHYLREIKLGLPAYRYAFIGQLLPSQTWTMGTYLHNSRTPVACQRPDDRRLWRQYGPIAMPSVKMARAKGEAKEKCGVCRAPIYHPPQDSAAKWERTPQARAYRKANLSIAKRNGSIL